MLLLNKSKKKILKKLLIPYLYSKRGEEYSREAIFPLGEYSHFHLKMQKCHIMLHKFYTKNSVHKLFIIDLYIDLYLI